MAPWEAACAIMRVRESAQREGARWTAVTVVLGAWMRARNAKG